MFTYKENLQRLFDKQMTRREFLAHIGTAVLIVVGVKGLLDHLGNFSSPEKPASRGYGSSSYGG